MLYLFSPMILRCDLLVELFKYNKCMQNLDVATKIRREFWQEWSTKVFWSGQLARFIPCWPFWILKAVLRCRVCGFAGGEQVHPLQPDWYWNPFYKFWMKLIKRYFIIQTYSTISIDQCNVCICILYIYSPCRN